MFFYNAFKARSSWASSRDAVAAWRAGLGYLTLAVRGVFFAIASLASPSFSTSSSSNWDYVGGAPAPMCCSQGHSLRAPRYIH